MYVYIYIYTRIYVHAFWLANPSNNLTAAASGFPPVFSQHARVVSVVRLKQNVRSKSISRKESGMRCCRRSGGSFHCTTHYALLSGPLSFVFTPKRAKNIGGMHLFVS